LREYIKHYYPLYKHTRSITAFGSINVPMSDIDLNRYKELEPDYDYIVPRCEHIFDERFSELDQSKYEIMLNDTCIYNCPYYGAHFEKIAEQNRLYNKPWSDAGEEEMKNIEECWLSEESTYKKPDFFNPETGFEKDKRKHGNSYGMDLKSEQIKQLVSRGICNFKITGREMRSDKYRSEIDIYLNALDDN
jgi:hypothetical protein